MMSRTSQRTAVVVIVLLSVAASASRGRQAPLVLLNAGALVATVDPATASFAIAAGPAELLRSGLTWATLDNRTVSTADGNLKLSKTTESSGALSCSAC